MLDKAAAFAGCVTGDEGREGIAAFLEKRRPAWAESDANDSDEKIQERPRGEPRRNRRARDANGEVARVPHDRRVFGRGRRRAARCPADDTFLLGRSPSASRTSTSNASSPPRWRPGPTRFIPVRFPVRKRGLRTGRGRRGSRVHWTNTRIDTPDGQQGRGKALDAGSGVPCVPGTRARSSRRDIGGSGRSIGYPIMVKAAAGGGGAACDWSKTARVAGRPASGAVGGEGRLRCR